MQSVRKIVLRTGIVGGLLFVIHASFPYVYSWPMIWPALAGATAFWLATREPHPHRLRTGLVAAFATGVITGAIAFVGTSIVVYVALHTARSVRQTGVPPGLITSAGIIALAVLGMIDVVVAFIAGALMLPVRYFQIRHAHTQ
jgi:hypothetical protein